MFPKQSFKKPGYLGSLAYDIFFQSFCLDSTMPPEIMCAPKAQEETCNEGAGESVERTVMKAPGTNRTVCAKGAGDSDQNNKTKQTKQNTKNNNTKQQNTTTHGIGHFAPTAPEHFEQVAPKAPKTNLNV